MSENVTYTRVHLIRDGYALVVSVDDDLTEDSVDHAAIYNLVDGQWYQLNYEVAVCGSWRVVDDKPKFVTVGVEGSVFTYDGDEGRETLDEAEDGPSDLVTLRCGAIIQDELYVAGMLRYVYRRKNGGHWERIDSTVRLGPEVDEGRGFLVLAGNRADSIFAAGYAGEIWHYDGKIWSDLESPTNVALSGMAISPEGEVCVVGQLGTILLGSEDGWRLLVQEETEDDFWGAAYFAGQFIIASDTSLWRIEGDSLSKVDIDIGPSETSFGQLSTNGEILWSVGEKDILQTKDAVSWSIVDEP